MPHVIESTLDGSGLKVAVLRARWYPEVTERLLEGALAVLKDAGVLDENVLVVEVPGAFELSQAAMWVARSEQCDAIVALGCVVRGETPHFEYVAGGAAEGCMRAAQENGVPIGFGVITADTKAQAEARSRLDGSGGMSDKGGNKGAEAADAAVRLARTYKRLEDRKR